MLVYYKINKLYSGPYGFVCAAGGQDEFGVRVEAKAVHLRRVRVHCVRWLRRVVTSVKLNVE